MDSEIDNIIDLNSFDNIDLKTLDDLNFLNRKDAKFIFHRDILPHLLQNLVSDYKILEIAGIRTFRYESQYFDTPDFKFYNDHHRGKEKRQKIRIRKYVDSGLSFIEIKTKNGKGRCVKKRLSADSTLKKIPANFRRFIDQNSEVNPDQLLPSLLVSVHRATLVHKEGIEKVTIDYDITFQLGKRIKTLENIIISEVKQKELDRDSPFLKNVKDFGISYTSFSKYCIGMACLSKGIKSNRFKPIILQLKKLQ